MPYVTEHMVLQFGGHVVSGDTATSPAIEIFSGTFRFGGPGLDQADADGPGIALAVVLANYWQKLGANIPSNAWLEYVKWNRVGTDGRYVSSSSSRTENITPVQGALAPRYPLQVCWATTWGTDAVRGKAVRSHTFWPTAVTIQKDVLVAYNDAAAKAALDNQLIADLNDAARNGYVDTARLTVPGWATAVGWAPATTRDGSGMSMMVMSKIGAGTNRVITHSEIGRRLDIQRRRANDQEDPRVQAD